MRERLDLFLVARGDFDSRARAQAAIKAGKVSVNGAVSRRPAEAITSKDVVTAGQVHPWVSRAGLKLDHALTYFRLRPEGLICLDIGASTGGFTQVLRARGAAKVYAVDVGTAQLHPDIKADGGVISLEQQDARSLTRAHIPDAIGLVVCDASFISLTKVLPAALGLADIGADLITLVKPQFEVGPDGVGRGGIVRDRAMADDALLMARAWVSDQGWRVMGSCDSPILGGSGNREFLLHARKSA